MKISTPRLTLALATLLAAPAFAEKPAKAGKAAQASSSSSKWLDKNLLKNPGAESQPRDKAPPPSWDAKPPTDEEGVEVADYGSVGGEWDHGVTGAPKGGNRYFRLYFKAGTKEQSMSQPVDVSGVAQDIDAGRIEAQLSGYLGAFVDADSTAQIIATYLDAQGKELGKLETAPINAATLPKPQVGSAALTPVQAGGVVPANTRKIVVKVYAKATGDSGDFLGLADNLSLVLHPKQDKAK